MMQLLKVKKKIKSIDNFLMIPVADNPLLKKAERLDIIHPLPKEREVQCAGNQFYYSRLNYSYLAKQLKLVEELIRILNYESNRPIEFFTIHVSVRFSDRSEVTQHKINFVKKCSQWGLNSQPPDHQSHALPLC